MSIVNGAQSPAPSPSKTSSAEKRAVHNALERKRRDHIKDMFSQLKDSVPNLAGEKVAAKASRAQILKRACEYIQMMRRKNQSATKDLELMGQHITRTKKQIAKLESVRNTNRYITGLPASAHTESSPSIPSTPNIPQLSQESSNIMGIPGPLPVAPVLDQNPSHAQSKPSPSPETQRISSSLCGLPSGSLPMTGGGIVNHPGIVPFGNGPLPPIPIAMTPSTGLQTFPMQLTMEQLQIMSRMPGAHFAAMHNFMMQQAHQQMQQQPQQQQLVPPVMSASTNPPHPAPTASPALSNPSPKANNAHGPPEELS